MSADDGIGYFIIVVVLGAIIIFLFSMVYSASNELQMRSFTDKQLIENHAAEYNKETGKIELIKREEQ